MSNWQELGDRVFRRRWESLDLNIGLVLSEQSVLVIDSRATHGQADELIAEIGLVTSRPVTHLVNTHHHWDHTFGNARFAGADLFGHRRCRETLIEKGETMRGKLLDAAWIPPEAKPHFAEVEIVPPDHVFDDRLEIQLDDRIVRLEYLGKGHTDNDIIIDVDDVTFAGDLVEEGAPPQFGDAYPRDWLNTLDRLATHVRGTVVPGHGDVVDHGFILDQRDRIARAIDGETMFPDQIMDQLRKRLDPS